MSEVEQRRGQLPGAVAERVPSAAKVRRNAWLLAGLAVFFYVGFIVWNLIKAQL